MGAPVDRVEPTELRADGHAGIMFDAEAFDNMALGPNRGRAKTRARLMPRAARHEGCLVTLPSPHCIDLRNQDYGEDAMTNISHRVLVHLLGFLP